MFCQIQIFGCCSEPGGSMGCEMVTTAQIGRTAKKTIETWQKIENPPK